jgi:hypothetical protein
MWIGISGTKTGFTGGSCKHVKQSFAGALSSPSALFIHCVLPVAVVTLITVHRMEPYLGKFHFNTAMCSNQ